MVKALAVQSLEEILVECEQLHGHMCAGQLLGARMALLGCRLVELDDPRGVDRRKTIVWVEIDRCMADAVSAATGVRLGKRSLKYVDYGKVAATFLNTETSKAVRIVTSLFARRMHSFSERVAWPTLRPRSHSRYRMNSTICSPRGVCL